MIHDEDLKSRQDYNEGQKAAAHRVLVELVNLFMKIGTISGSLVDGFRI